MKLEEYFAGMTDTRHFGLMTIDVQKMFCDKLDIAPWAERFRDWISLLTPVQRDIDHTVANIIETQNVMRAFGSQIIHVRACMLFDE